MDQILRWPETASLVRRHGRAFVLRELRALLDERRREPSAPLPTEAMVAALRRTLELAAAPSLVPLINATGVVIHTNLGRAPLSRASAERVAEIAQAYSNLEFDLVRGERGDREVHAEERLRALLGAEATLVVNNNAAAVLLALNTLAEGREAVVSRGELVEIGGSFRIPDVLRKAGARLVEVGTTNRTRISDFESAIGEATGAILKVHPSNFRIVGFAETPEIAALVALARGRGVPLVEDLGSGLIDPLGALGDEPVVATRLRAGVDIVTFSGDKLLGGPQAGLVAGRQDVVSRMRKNPLYRALRVDKLTLSALDSVLIDHQSGLAEERLPVLRLVSLPAESVRARAEALAEALRPLPAKTRVSVIPGESAVGGGAAPATALPTFLLAIAGAPHPAAELLARLRAARPPVIARVADDKLLLDLRTVLEEQDEPLLAALRPLVCG